MQRFKDLKVWRRSHELVKRVYDLTRHFPRDEREGIVSQLRRAAVSVPTNIAEGAKRLRPGDYARFLNIAEASLAETHYLLLLSRDLGFLPTAVFESREADAEEIARMLFALRKKLRSADFRLCQLRTVDRRLLTLDFR